MEIRPIRLPAGLSTPSPSEIDGDTGAAELEAYAALIRRLDAELLGTTELARSPRELLVDLTGDPYTARVALGAFDDDDGGLAGIAEIQWELDDDARTAYLPLLGVEPVHRRHGIGSQLLVRAEQIAAAAGRPTLVLSGEHLLRHDDGRGERLRAPQGAASIPARSIAARFALAHGYSLGQLDRISVLAVVGRGDEFRRRLGELEASGSSGSSGSASGYRIATWTDRAPDDLVDSLARAHERMSVDPPTGAIAYEFEPWDAARVRDDERRCLEMERITLTAAAVAPDGEVAGFTQLSLLPRSTGVEQWDTIVLAAHRGHRLGLRLKLANLLLLIDADPTRERVYTWNADENAHMLAINVALGFEGFALESVWQKG